MKLTSGGFASGEVNIKRGIFQGDRRSPLLFIFELNETKIRYKLGKNREKINHLIFMDDLKLDAKNRNELDSLVQTVRMFSKEVGTQFGIQKCAMVERKRVRMILSEGIGLRIGKQSNQWKTKLDTSTFQYCNTT